jgi:hypothetical protein
MPENKEPVYTAGLAGGVATGATYLVLQDPIRDILLELGSTERLAKSLVSIFMFLLPIAVSILTSWWARNRTVPVGLANRQIEAAFEMPANSPQHKLEELKIGTETEKKEKVS